MPPVTFATTWRCGRCCRKLKADGMASEVRSRKRKHIGKNKKKGWKHTDIQDVEDFLEDKRLQERTGGLVAEKRDEQLFFVERGVEKDPVPNKRRRKEPKPLRCHSILEPNPNIKPVKIAGAKAKKVKKTYQNTTKEKQFLKAALAAKQRQDAAKRRKAQEETAGVQSSCAEDLWEDEGLPEDRDDTLDHHEAVTQIKRAKVPQNVYNIKSELPAVEVPHPGASYNPAYDDHQDLLLKAHEIEVRKLQESKKLDRALKSIYESRATKGDYLAQMSTGLTAEASDAEEHEEETDWFPVSSGKEERKTTRQRRKQKEKKEKEKKLQQEKEQRIRDSDIFRLKGIKRDIDKKLREQNEKKRQKAELRDAKNKTQTKKLGSTKFTEPDIELKLSDELEGSLLKLKPEGHLLSDRLSSLQKRNIIEPRGGGTKPKRRKRKLQRKTFFRR